MRIDEFLLARYAEDEAVAREVLADWGDAGPATPVPLQATDGPGYTVAAMQPDRLLAECEAKRRIVERFEFERRRRDARRSPAAREVEDDKATQDRRTQEARSRVAEDVLLLLALPHLDHPDFDEEWRI